MNSDGLKVSEVIAKLNYILATQGDIPVITQSHFGNIDSAFVTIHNVDYTFNIAQSSTTTYEDVDIENSTGVAALIN